MRTSNTVCSPQVLGSQVALNIIRKQVISLPTLGPRTNSAPQVALTSPKHTHRQASTILVSSYMDIYTLICPPAINGLRSHTSVHLLFPDRSANYHLQTNCSNEKG